MVQIGPSWPCRLAMPRYQFPTASNRLGFRALSGASLSHDCGTSTVWGRGSQNFMVVQPFAERTRYSPLAGRGRVCFHDAPA